MQRYALRALAFGALGAALLSTPRVAQAGADNPECLGSNCGSPREEVVAPAPEAADFFGALGRLFASFFSPARP